MEREPVFSEILRRFRTDRGLTQEQLASASDMSVAAIRDMEQGRRQRPRSESLARLAAALGLDPSQAGELARACQPGSPAPRSAGLPAEHAAGLRLRVFGPLAASRAGQADIQLGPPRQRALLGLLALNANDLVHRETIIDALWGDGPPGTATSLVQAYASRLRQLLAPQRARGRQTLLDAVGASYRLGVSEAELDLLAFRHLSERASRAAAGGDPLAAFELFEQALEVGRGIPLADVDLLRGHVAAAEVAAEQSAVVLHYATAAVSIGRHDKVLPHLRVMTRLEPLNERAHAYLMIVLAGLGQQAEALQVYRDLCQRLDSQLGVRPAAQLKDAHIRVLRQDVPAARLVMTPLRPFPFPAVSAATAAKPAREWSVHEKSAARRAAYPLPGVDSAFFRRSAPWFP